MLGKCNRNVAQTTEITSAFLVLDQKMAKQSHPPHSKCSKVYTYTLLFPKVHLRKEKKVNYHTNLAGYEMHLIVKS